MNVDLNQMGFLDPEGRFYPTDGATHPGWANENADLVGFVGTRDMKFDPATGDDAFFDENGAIALEWFFMKGWVRVKPNEGVELQTLTPKNVEHVKRVLRQMARDNEGHTLSVDEGDTTYCVPVSTHGRPDFSEVDLVLLRGKKGRFR